MKKEFKYIFSIVLVLCLIYFLKPKILKAMGWSYRDIYNVNITIEEIENIKNSLDIQYLGYEWSEEYESTISKTCLTYLL